MRRERGVALILALLLVAAAAVFALAAASRTRDVAMDGVRDRASATARAAAEGGIERARWALARDVAYEGETLRVGDCDVVVTVSSSDGEDRTITALADAPAAPFATSVTWRADAAVVLRGDELPRVVVWSEAR